MCDMCARYVFRCVDLFVFDVDVMCVFVVCAMCERLCAQSM